MKKKFLFALSFFSLLNSQVPGAAAVNPVYGEKNFPDLVEENMKSVVNISLSMKSFASSSVRGPDERSFLLDQFLGHFLGLPRSLDRLPQRPRSYNSLGSGFIIADLKGKNPNDTFVVTNAHVLQMLTSKKKGENVRFTLMVTFDSGEKMEAELAAFDTESDVAVLRLKTASPKKGLSWGDSDQLRRGDFVWAGGNPYGMGGTVTTGICSYKNRSLEPNDRSGSDGGEWIQTDAAINQGSSGGPLFYGKLVMGMNTAIVTNTGANSGIALAIPANRVKAIVEQLVTKGCVLRSYIGVKLGAAITPDFSQALGMKETKGVLIDVVNKGEPAEKAGLKNGDVILRVNDVSVDSPHKARYLIRTTVPGQKVKLSIWRRGKQGGKEMDINVTTLELCRLAQGSHSSKEKDQLGIHFRPLNDREVRALESQEALSNVNLEESIVVKRVEMHSGVADQLHVGDIILQVNGQPVQSEEQVRKALRQAREDKKGVFMYVARPTNKKGDPMAEDIESADYDVRYVLIKPEGVPENASQSN